MYHVVVEDEFKGATPEQAFANIETSIVQNKGEFWKVFYEGLYQVQFIYRIGNECNKFEDHFYSYLPMF